MDVEISVEYLPLSHEHLSVEQKIFQPLLCTAALQLLLERQTESRNDVAGIVKVGVVNTGCTHFPCVFLFSLGAVDLLF